MNGTQRILLALTLMLACMTTLAFAGVPKAVFIEEFSFLT